MSREKKISWLERIEEIVGVLEGSTIGELELTEGDTEIVIRRQPGVITSIAAHQQLLVGQTGVHGGSNHRAPQSDPGVAVVAPLTGVYYSAASPSSPAFVNIGDIVQIGQVVALVEAMKVFNEITAEISGRVIAMVATNGNVVQKGDVLLRIEQA